MGLWYINTLFTESYRVNKDEIFDIWTKHGMYTDEDRVWQRRVMEKAGLAANGTYLPPAINPSKIDRPTHPVRNWVLVTLDSLITCTGIPYAVPSKMWAVFICMFSFAGMIDLASLARHAWNQEAHPHIHSVVV